MNKLLFGIGAVLIFIGWMLREPYYIFSSGIILIAIWLWNLFWPVLSDKKHKNNIAHTVSKIGIIYGILFALLMPWILIAGIFLIQGHVNPQEGSWGWYSFFYLMSVPYGTVVAVISLLVSALSKNGNYRR